MELSNDRAVETREDRPPLHSSTPRTLAQSQHLLVVCWHDTLILDPTAATSVQRRQSAIPTYHLSYYMTIVEEDYLTLFYLIPEKKKPAHLQAKADRGQKKMNNDISGPLGYLCWTERGHELSEIRLLHCKLKFN